MWRSLYAYATSGRYTNFGTTNYQKVEQDSIDDGMKGHSCLNIAGFA